MIAQAWLWLTGQFTVYPILTEVESNMANYKLEQMQGGSRHEQE